MWDKGWEWEDIKGTVLGFLIVVAIVVGLLVTAFAIYDNIKTNAANATAADPVVQLSTSPIQDEGLPVFGPNVETDGWNIAPRGYIEYCKLSPTDC